MDTKQRWHNDRLVSASEPVDSDAFFAGVREQPKVWPKVPRWPMFRPGLAIYGVAVVAIGAQVCRMAVPATTPSAFVERAPDPVLASTVYVTGPMQIDTGMESAIVACSEGCYIGTEEASPASIPLMDGTRERIRAPAGHTIHVWATGGTIRAWR